MISKYLVFANSTDIIDLFDTCLNLLFMLIFGLQMKFSGVRVQIIFEIVNLQVHIYIVIALQYIALYKHNNLKLLQYSCNVLTGMHTYPEPIYICLQVNFRKFKRQMALRFNIIKLHTFNLSNELGSYIYSMCSYVNVNILPFKMY
jgi:hypothetical protein